MTRMRWWMIACGVLLAIAASTAHGQSKPEVIPPPKCCEQPASCPACCTTCSPATVKESGPAKECGIARRLQKSVSVDFKDAPFRQIVQDLREWSGINICLDEVNLKEEGVDLDHPVTLKLEGVSLKSALNVLTKQLHLKCAVRDGGVHITTEPCGSHKLPGGVSSPASYMPITTFVTAIFEGGAIGMPVPVTRYVPCPGDGTTCGASAAQPTCADPRRTASCPSGLAESSAQPKCCLPPIHAEGTRPVHERCYAGGFRSMRGFQFPEIVPGAHACQIDGGAMFLHTLEYQVPVLGNDRLYRITFVDSGTVGCNAEVQEQRVSAGAGIRIVVPMLGPAPIALDFGFPIAKPETTQATPEPLPPPQCCPPPTPSSAEVHSAKTEPAKTCGCCTCCPKCCESKTKQKRARIRVIAPPDASVTYVPPPMPPILPAPPAVGVMAAPMIAAPMLGAPPPCATAPPPPPTFIYSHPVSEDVIKQCEFTAPVPPPTAPTPEWTMRVASEDGHACLEFRAGHQTSVLCPHMSVKIAQGEHLKLVASGNQIGIQGAGFRALTDTITRLGDATERIVLEGHVRMKYHKGDASADIAADRVVIDMKDGSLAVMSALKGTDPAAAKDQLFHFWIGMFQ